MALIRRGTASRILRIIPRDRIELGDLLSRLADGEDGTAYAPAVEWTAVRKPTSLETIAFLQGDADQQWTDFQIFKVGGQTVDPGRLDRWVDADGRGWEVKRVQDAHFGVVWTMHCLPMQGGQPGAAVGFHVDDVDDESTSLDFAAPSSPPSPLARYELYRSTDGRRWTRLADLAADATSAFVSGLAALTAYHFRLRAVAVDGQKGPYATATGTTTG